jgi:hypothetical protein
MQVCNNNRLTVRRGRGVEDVFECNRCEGRVTACRPALDGEPRAIDEALLREVQGASAAVLDVHGAPLAVEALAVLPPVAGGSTVVHIENSDAPRCEKLNVNPENGGSCPRWSPVKLY